MSKIEKVEIYFEPQGAVKMTMQLGAQVSIPLQKGIPAAIKTADQVLGMSGRLSTYASDQSLNVQITDEKSDSEWATFISGKCTNNTQWKRWNAETTQGRWNVIVFFIESSPVKDINSTEKSEVKNYKQKQHQEENSTSLLKAALKGNKELSKQLIDAGADVNAVDINGITALIWATALEGHKEIVKQLIDAGADVNAADKDGRTALMASAVKDHKEIVKQLIDAGANVNTTAKNGTTPLMETAYNAHTEIVKQLIDAGADVNVAINLAKRWGKTNVVKMLKKEHTKTKSLFSFWK